MDSIISKWILDSLHGNSIINNIMVWITNIGIGYALWLVLFLIVFIYKLISKKKVSIFALTGMVFLLVCYVLGDMVIKNIVQRPRPFHEFPAFITFMESLSYSLPTGYSFPSGHSFCAMYGAMAFFLFNKKTGFVLIPFALLVGFSRIFLGAHYFSDVIVGLILGIIFAFISYYLIRLMANKWKENNRLCV